MERVANLYKNNANGLALSLKKHLKQHVTGKENPNLESKENVASILEYAEYSKIEDNVKMEKVFANGKEQK